MKIKEKSYKGIFKWIFAAIVIIIVLFFGFLVKINEGQCAIITRFGAARAQITKAGMYFKLPWPFEDVKTYDAKKQYMDSGYLETLTKDKKNVIMQTYMIWSIQDPLKYYTSVGENKTAEKYLNDLLINAKNGIMGNYELINLVSLISEDIKIDQIEQSICDKVINHAQEQYGIKVYDIKIKRLGLPKSNIESVFEQMQADRQKYIDELLAEGKRDAQIIMNKADSDAAEIVAKGKQEAAGINAQTEREVAQIYADAYSKDPELFKFLKKLIALDNTVDENTIFITRKDNAPFDALDGID